jgi:hypothetical protein
MYYRGLPTILVKLQNDKGNTSSKDNRAWGLGPWGDKKGLNIDTTFFLLIIPLFLYVPNGLTCLSMPSYIHHFQLCKNSPDQITSIPITFSKSTKQIAPTYEHSQNQRFRSVAR